MKIEAKQDTIKIICPACGKEQKRYCPINLTGHHDSVIPPIGKYCSSCGAEYDAGEKPELTRITLELNLHEFLELADIAQKIWHKYEKEELREPFSVHTVFVRTQNIEGIIRYQ